MVNHQLVTATENGGTLITFEDAVILTNLLQGFINTDQGRLILAEMGRQFDLELKDNFVIKYGTITKNCPECMGCNHQGSCILGCTKIPGFDLCYWDEALEQIVGTQLVIHELAHVWFPQAFVHNMDPDSDEFFELSEEFAQFVEEKFSESLVFCTVCQDFVIDLKVLEKEFPTIWENVFVSSVIVGFAFAIGSFLATLIIGSISGKKENLVEV